ncbi:MAG: Nif3-like dinuclear metal center hexameric protein [Firmicutes bacterium HGW-Firmicutes-15]|nr:MAG: Nif3-like dinuclear metal center hexameric protein [Firmicutes bacterium HGW-Firmicutes-15]
MQGKVRDIVKIMESFFPVHLAESWDNVGLQVGSYNAPANRVLVALDLDKEVLQYALDQKADMIITHHPLFFTGIKSINYEQSQGSLLKGIIKAGITVYAAHTNLDAGERGLNQILAERIGLHDIKPLDKGHSEALYKLVVYVPIGHEEAVRQAINGAGAGHLGRYTDCSFRTKGTGLFRPLAGSKPFIGHEAILEEVEEYRLETVVPQPRLGKVLQEMLKAHPYEEAAYDIYLLENRGKVFSLGRTGKLAEMMSLQEFCAEVKMSLGLEFLRVVGDMNRSVKNIAVVSGAGASLMSKAQKQRCDVLLTGDLKYHEAKDAEALGIAVIDAGHQGTERIMANYLRDLLNEEKKRRGLDLEVISINGRECIVTV